MDQWNSSLNGSSPTNSGWCKPPSMENGHIPTAHVCSSITKHSPAIYLNAYHNFYIFKHIYNQWYILEVNTENTLKTHQIKSTCAAEAHLQSRHGSFQPAWQGGTISTSEGLTAYLLMKRKTRIQGMIGMLDV